jgi:hypothetical protein
VNPRAGLDFLKKEIYVLPLPGTEPRFPSYYTDWTIPAPVSLLPSEMKLVLEAFKMKAFCFGQCRLIFLMQALLSALYSLLTVVHKPLKYDLNWSSQESRDIVLGAAYSNGSQ